MLPDGCSEWVERQVSKCAKMIVLHDIGAHRELSKLKPEYHRWAFVEALQTTGDNPDTMHFILVMDESHVEPLYSYCCKSGYPHCADVLYEHCKKCSRHFMSRSSPALVASSV